MSRVLVTGGAGFIGSHLVRALLERGDAVRIIDRPGAQHHHLPLADVDYRPIDIRDREAVRNAAQGCTIVYHLAANPQLWTQRKGHFRQVNTIGTMNVLDAAIAAGAERILHTSTESILTRAEQTTPIAEDQQVRLRDVIGPYCRSKYHAEQYAFALAKQGHPVLIVNPTLPIGPGDWGRSPPTQMILDCARGKRAIYLDAELNLIDVRDIVAGMIAAVERGQPGRRYLLGGENWSIRRLFDFVANECQQTPPRYAIPYPLALAAAVVSEWIADVFTHTIPAASVTGVKLTRRRMQFDSQASLQALSIVPRPVMTTLREALAWYRHVGWIPG